MISLVFVSRPILGTFYTMLRKDWVHYISSYE